MTSLKRKLTDSPPHSAKRRLVTCEFPYPNLSSGAPTSSPLFQQPLSLLTFSYVLPDEQHPDTQQEVVDSRQDITSNDPNRKLVFDNQACKFFVQPKLGSDLNYGYDRWIRRSDERGRLDALLRACSRIKGFTTADNSIVCWRGVLTKILTAPYEERDGFEMNVTCIGQTMFFEEHSSEEKLNNKNNMDARNHLQSYYGYAFEEYCTVSGSDTQQSQKNAPLGWSSNVNTNQQWCSVVKTKLGDTRIIIGGEVDCVRGSYQSNSTSNFVELKTSMVIRGAQDEARFEKKLLKFYFQSFLLGVPEIFVGFRTPKGILKTTQSFETLKIPRLVRDKPGAWQPSVCLNWGSEVIDRLRTLATSDVSTPQVFRVKFTPKVGIQVYLLDAAGIADVENGEDRVGFLPRWFWDEQTAASKSSSNPHKVKVEWKI